MSSADTSGGPDLSGALAAGAVALLPEQIQDLLKPGKTPERINHAITWAARRDPAVLQEHIARHHAVKRFEDIRDLPLKQLDDVAKHFARKFRRRALLTGAITGLPGGLWALVAAGADVQLTAVYAVRMAADIAQSYGYDTSIIEEQAHLAEVLALAAGIDSLRGVGNWLTREGLIHVLPELLPKILIKVSVEITEEQAAKLVGRLIPGVGAAVGGAIDYTFLRVAGERATAYYRNRYMIDHGLALPDTSLAAPVNPAFAPKTVTGTLAPPQTAAAAVAPSAAPGTSALPAPQKVAQPAKQHKRAPERFAIYLAIFAVFALGITILACGALAVLAYSGIQHLFH
jgi:hypothetical protein